MRLYLWAWELCRSKSTNQECSNSNQPWALHFMRNTQKIPPRSFRAYKEIKFWIFNCRGWKNRDLWNLKVMSEKTHIPAHEKRLFLLFWRLGSNLRPAWTRAGHFASCWEQNSKTLRIYNIYRQKQDSIHYYSKTFRPFGAHCVNKSAPWAPWQLKNICPTWGSWRCLRARRGSSAGCCFSWAMSPRMKHGIS